MAAELGSRWMPGRHCGRTSVPGDAGRPSDKFRKSTARNWLDAGCAAVLTDGLPRVKSPLFSLPLRYTSVSGRAWSVAARWAACLALVAVAGVQLGAQQTPLRKIYEMDLAIRALSASVESTLVLPKAVAGGVRITLRAGSRELSLADAARLFGGDVHVKGELSGPGLPQTLTLPRTPSEDEPALPGDNDPLLLRLPALPTAGNYALTNLRLVRGTTTVLDVPPRQVDIQVIDEVLITSVKTRPLTLAEIRAKGIVLDSDDYLGSSGLSMSSGASDGRI
jgi:hypothetical protein